MACIKNIGCFLACDPIELFPAEENGEHILLWEWLGVQRDMKIAGSEGENLIIDNIFNEHSDVNFTLKAPSGKYYDENGDLTAEKTTLQFTVK